MELREWTIMIYMAGDNNLAVDMAYALEQIKAVAGRGPNSPNIFVYYDGNSVDIPTLYCDFTDPDSPKYVRSFQVANKRCSVSPRINENAADKRSVLNFVNWCVNQAENRSADGSITYGRRARKYALIFSGHSLGFQDTGLFRDESSGKSMKMNDLFQTFREMVSTGDELTALAAEAGWSGDQARAGTVLLGQKLDILGFDSCVMGMLEVGYQFKEFAKTMIASEGSVPNAGWTYAKILGNLAADPGGDASGRAVAEKFVRDFIKSQDAFTIGGISVDMSAWDLSRMRPLAIAFNDLAGALLECFKQPGTPLYRQMERAMLQVHWQCQSYMYDQNVDLGDFCELLDQECVGLIADLPAADSRAVEELQRLCRNVLTELREAVILCGFSGGAYQYSNGISIFFPWSRDGYEASRKNYESLFVSKTASANGTAKRGMWPLFLRKYLSDVALRKSAPPTTAAAPGEKYRYESGLPFYEAGVAAAVLSNGTSKLAGQEGTKLAGQEGSKLAGQEGTKLAGMEGTKLAGQEGSKLAGQEGTKLAGQEGTKLAGQEGTKLAGQEGTKLAGQEGTKLAGQEGTKLGGGSGSRFFESLRLFKNIETRWNISGFSKPPAERETGSDAASG
jgi:hypothetical protein